MERQNGIGKEKSKFSRIFNPTKPVKRSRFPRRALVTKPSRRTSRYLYSVSPLSYNDWRLTPDTSYNGGTGLHNCYFNKLIFAALERHANRAKREREEEGVGHVRKKGMVHGVWPHRRPRRTCRD